MLSSPIIYVDPQGGEHKTDAETARLMAQRDVEEAKQKTLALTADGATPEGKSLIAAVIALGDKPVFERPKTWDERLLPWANVLMFLFGKSFGGTGFGWQSGQSAASVSGNGNNVTVVGRMNSSATSPGTASSVEPWSWNMTRSDTSNSNSYNQPNTAGGTP